MFYPLFGGSKKFRFSLMRKKEKPTPHLQLRWTSQEKRRSRARAALMPMTPRKRDAPWSSDLIFNHDFFDDSFIPANEKIERGSRQTRTHKLTNCRRPPTPSTDATTDTLDETTERPQTVTGHLSLSLSPSPLFPSPLYLSLIRS